MAFRLNLPGLLTYNSSSGQWTRKRRKKKTPLLEFTTKTRTQRTAKKAHKTKTRKDRQFAKAKARQQRERAFRDRAEARQDHQQDPTTVRVTGVRSNPRPQPSAVRGQLTAGPARMPTEQEARDAGLCGARTQEGYPCMRTVADGGTCPFHKTKPRTGSKTGPRKSGPRSRPTAGSRS